MVSSKKNKLARLTPEATPISWIIRKPVTSKLDLERLCEKLGIPVMIDWIDNYNKDLESNERIGQILNIDADHIGGSHWVATCGEHYFDSFGLPPAREWLDHLKWNQMQVQSRRSGGCGNYAVLWLHYATQGRPEEFYSLF
jgi:hypothetical protein